MPTTLTFRRGTTSQNNSFTGAAGEISVDTDKKTLRLHDASTAGGSEIVAVAATQTLTNKTLTTPVISSISNTGTLTLPTSTDTLVGRATTDTLTNKTLTSAVLNTGVSGTAVLDEDNMASNSATKLATQQSIKAYVDTAISSLSSTTIQEGNTTLVVADAGSGTITATVDGATVATFQAGDLALPNNVGLLFGTGGEKIESNGTDLTVTSTGALNLTVTGTTTVSGALTVTGNLTVNGTTTTVNSTNTTIDDNLLELNSGAASNANDCGIIIERGSTGNNAIFMWDESADTFTLGTTTATASTTGNITVAVGTLVANLTGTATAAQYSDVAERFASDRAYDPGTVVALGGTAEITAVAEEASNQVFGVVSGTHQAAFKMNGAAGTDETHPYVAMTGRVNVKVIGTVNKGDRLISSSIPGVARAAVMTECTAFNVIGRALTSKNSEEQGSVLAAVRVSH